MFGLFKKQPPRLGLPRDLGWSDGTLDNGFSSEGRLGRTHFVLRNWGTYQLGVTKLDKHYQVQICETGVGSKIYNVRHLEDLPPAVLDHVLAVFREYEIMATAKRAKYAELPDAVEARFLQQKDLQRVTPVELRLLK